MAFITKEELKQILQNSPEGTSYHGIVAALRAKGHVLEGYDQAQKKKSSVFGKLGSATEATFGRASEFLFGTPARTISSLIGGGIESAADLAKGKVKPVITRPEESGAIFKPEETGAADIAFTALDIAPELKPIAATLKRIPGTTRVFEGITKLFEKIPGKLKESAIKEWEKVFSATTKQTKRLTQKIAPEISERGVIAGGRKSLQEKAASKAAKIGEEITQSFDELPETVRVNAKPIIDKLEKKLSEYTVNGVIVDPNIANKVTQLKDVILELGPEIEVGSIRKLRQILDKQISKKAGFEKFADEITNAGLEAQKTVANAIRNELAQQFPDIAKLNKEYTFWTRVSDVLGKAIERKTSQTGSLTRGVRQVAGAAVGGQMGAGLGATLGVVAFDKLGQLVDSTLWKTVSAKTKNKIADLLSSGKFSELETLVEQLIIRGRED